MKAYRILHKPTGLYFNTIAQNEKYIKMVTNDILKAYERKDKKLQKNWLKAVKGKFDFKNA